MFFSFCNLAVLLVNTHSLNFNSQYWPDEQDALAFWSSLAGETALKAHFSVQSIRQFFQSRRPCGAPDIDGWRCREHLLPMFMNDDTELHDIIRSELILPVIFGDFHPQDLNELSGGWLFAFLKLDGVGIRPLNCSSAFRRCASSLICTHLKKPAHRFFTTSIPNF